MNFSKMVSFVNSSVHVNQGNSGARHGKVMEIFLRFFQTNRQVWLAVGSRNGIEKERGGERKTEIQKERQREKERRREEG